MLDVAIAGGGPGGLACALALRRAFKTINVKVFERSSAYRPQGATVLLNVNGVKAVAALDPQLLGRLQHKASPLLGFRALTKNGELVLEKESFLDDLASQFGVRPFNLGWHDIRHEMYSMLPEGTVDFGSQVTTASDCGDHAQLVVRKDGSGGEAVVKARVVVGADGYYSRLREYCIAGGAPTFSGSVCWRGRLDWREGLPKTMSRSYREAMPPTPGRLFILVPCSDNTVVWVAISPVSALSSAGLDYDHAARAVRDTSIQTDHLQEDVVQRVLSVYHDFHSEVLDVVSSTPPECITEHGLFSHNAADLAEERGKGNITLLGDAAHATIPNGQGCNLAFEDAVVLSYNLQQHGFNQKALRFYERERGPRVRVMMDFKEVGADAAQQQEAFGFQLQPLRQMAGVEVKP